MVSHERTVATVTMVWMERNECGSTCDGELTVHEVRQVYQILCS